MLRATTVTVVLLLALAPTRARAAAGEKSLNITAELTKLLKNPKTACASVLLPAWKSPNLVVNWVQLVMSCGSLTAVRS